MRYLFLLLLVLASCNKTGCVIDLDPAQGAVVLQDDSGVVKQYALGGYEIRQLKVGDNVTLRSCGDGYNCREGVFVNGRCKKDPE